MILRTIQKTAKAAAWTALLSLCAASASAATITWSGQSDFDRQQITFTAFQANQLTDVISMATTGSGGYAHSHGSPTDIFIKLRIDDVWTEVYRQTLNTTGSRYLADISSPINFTRGMVSGLWLDSSRTQSTTYHSFRGCVNAGCSSTGGNVAFVFSDVGSVASVPEPGSVALIGLGVLGFAARRRKQ